MGSSKTVIGYHIHAKDGDIGRVNNFIVDDQTWQIAYLVVDTHSWIGRKKVLIVLKHEQQVEWENLKVIVDVTTDAIKTSKEADNWGYTFAEYNQADYNKHAVHFKQMADIL